MITKKENQKYLRGLAGLLLSRGCLSNRFVFHVSLLTKGPDSADGVSS